MFVSKWYVLSVYEITTFRVIANTNDDDKEDEDKEMKESRRWWGQYAELRVMGTVKSYESILMNSVSVLFI